MCNFRHALPEAARPWPYACAQRTDGAKTRIKARDCTHSQARMEGRSTDRSGAAGGVYTRHRRVPLARCEKHVAITCPARE